MATEDGEVPTSDSPTLALIHVGKNPGSRLWSACDEARREYRKLCRQWELRSAAANTPTGAETP